MVKVIKRTGLITKFDKDKVVFAVTKAMNSVDELNGKLANEIAEEVAQYFSTHKEVSVEDIQDYVEDLLIKKASSKLAKSYIMYRTKRAEIREVKDYLGVEDDLKFGVNAIALLDSRYLKTADGKKETPSQMFKRVARHVASVEKNYGNNPAYWSKVFYNLMSNQYFLPNSPTLTNSGNKHLNHLHACFAFEIQDSIENIFQTVKDCAIVQRCIPRDTKITSSRGVVNAGDLVVGDFIWSVNGFKKINKVFDVGSKQSISIKIKDNEPVVVGINHPIYVYTNRRGYKTAKFVPAFKLNKNHRVALFTRLPDTHNGSFNSKFSFPTVLNGKKNVYNDCYVPNSIDNSVAYMLGLWFGDGSKDRLRVRFTNNDKKLHKYFVIGVSKFGLFKYGCYKNGNSAETTFNSKKLSSIFNHIGFFNKENIPATVFGWSDSLKVSFIEGLLDTDGSVKKQGHVCVVSNKNKQPILDVKTLLKTLGFSSYVSKINSGWSLYLYSCGIEDFAKLTTFNTRKKSLLSNIKSTVHHTVTRHDDIEFMLIENIETCNTKSMVDFEIENHTYNVKYLVTHNCGGGIGLHLSKLRPAGDMVKTTEGIASGPVSFMRVFDVTSEVIKQGSTRRGGNLGLLTITHPDIVEFIKCKNDENKLNNFNISISIPDSFMKSLKNDVDISLINPKTNKTVRKMSARQLFRLISESAWKNGEPGIVFWDKVQADNPTPSKGMLIKNLCGESDLLHGEACVLGSINLSKFVDREENKIIYSSLRKVVHHAVRFLDNVIDASDYPTKEIETTVKSNRKIGLGVMGFADTLFYLGIPYNSEEALKLAEEIMDFVNIEARKASSKLAEEKGNFPNIEESVLTPPLRNANLTTIAPTGSLSILAECSSGIEPTYGLVFVRKILDGRTFFEVSKSFEDIGKREGWFSQELVNKIANNNGSIRGIEEIPEKWQNIFVTAHEISPEYHVRIQSSFQKHTNSSISKTVNLPSTATVEDVEKIIKMAYDLNLKGLTVFRDGSRSEQVLSKPLCAECDVGICKL